MWMYNTSTGKWINCEKSNLPNARWPLTTATNHSALSRKKEKNFKAISESGRNSESGI